MSGAVLVALAAAFGNLLQGWDNATIAGTMTKFYYSRGLRYDLYKEGNGDSRDVLSSCEAKIMCYQLRGPVRFDAKRVEEKWRTKERRRKWEFIRC